MRAWPDARLARPQKEGQFAALRSGTGRPSKVAPTAPAGQARRADAASNPFQVAQEAKAKKRKQGSATSVSRVASSVEVAAAGHSGVRQPGKVKKKKKLASSRPLATSPPGPPRPKPVVAAPPRPVVGAVPLETLVSASLPDTDQRILYIGPLGSTDPTPLLRVLPAANSGPICVCMLHDWSTSRFLGAASVEYPSAAALKGALEKLLPARGPDGRVSLDDAGPVSLGLACSALRVLGAKAGEEGLNLGSVSGPLGGHTLELLGGSLKGVAAAALAEFVAVAGAAKSAKTLRQIVRRLQRRAALARVPHSFLWRGEATGLPLPAGPAKRMRAVLDALDWQAMGNNRNPTGQGKINVENSFSLGLATHKLSKEGPFSTPFAFRPGLGIWDGASVRKKHAEVWDAAWEMLRAVDPMFHCTSIGFNKNFRGSPHRDDKDSGPQVATALGDYTGGRLRVHTQTGALDVDTRQRWCRFDGRYEHEVLPFSGIRYSVIFYQLEPSFAVDLSTTVEGAS